MSGGVSSCLSMTMTELDARENSHCVVLFATLPTGALTSEREPSYSAVLLAGTRLNREEPIRGSSAAFDEEARMSENEPPEVPATALGPIRPLSVRITDGLRAQIEVIAQLNDRSVTEEIRLALEAWVETSKSDPKVLHGPRRCGPRSNARPRPTRARSRPSSEGSPAWQSHHQAGSGLTRASRPGSSTTGALPGVSAPHSLAVSGESRGRSSAPCSRLPFGACC